MRHGESKANALGIIISDPESGVERYGLTGQGRREALENARQFGESHRIDIVYSSDFRRALETARIAAAVFGAGEPVPTPLLRERRFGGLEGSGDDNYVLVWALDETDPGNIFRGVEPPRDVQRRAMELLHRCDAEHAGKRILLVAHGDVLQMLYCAANGIPVSRHRSIEPLQKAEIRVLQHGITTSTEVS